MNTKFVRMLALSLLVFGGSAFMRAFFNPMMQGTPRGLRPWGVGDPVAVGVSPKRAHYLQHVPFEGLGSIEPQLRPRSWF